MSKLRLNQNSAGVLKGEYVIPQSAGYQRFCSNFLVGAEHGFERELLLTNEEARDIVLRADGLLGAGADARDAQHRAGRRRRRATT